MRIEDIKTGDSLQGIEPTALVTVVAVVPISTDAIQLVYKTPDRILKDRLPGRHDEKNIAPATRERPWSFAVNRAFGDTRPGNSQTRLLSDKTSTLLCRIGIRGDDLPPFLLAASSRDLFRRETLPHQMPALQRMFITQASTSSFSIIVVSGGSIRAVLK